MNKSLNILFVSILTLVTVTSHAQNSSYLSTTTTGIQPPPPPNYNQCNGRTDEANCRMAVDSQYQQNLTYYNTIKAQEAEAQRQRDLQQQQYNGAQQAAAASRDQNNKASSAYGISQMLTQVASTIAMAKFVASCTPYCSNYAALALSIAMAIFSQQAGKQKNSHNVAAYNSCSLGNQVSTTQSNCGAPPGSFNYAGYPNNGPIDSANIIDPNGNCTATADICQQIQTGLPPGTSLKDYQKGLSAFASGKAPFKVNPDGSITNLKNGKTYTAADFSTPEGMAAAGMSPADIALAQGMSKNMGAIASTFDAKKELAGLNGSGGELGDEAARAAAAAAAAAADQAMNTNGFGKKDRNIAAAEGLAKDFNGELIGVAGDNIWKMMNRRYKLKTAQDAFMAAAKP